ncbi:MAG: heavy metal translocating P-type ATPase [Thermoprotei archaeon]
MGMHCATCTTSVERALRRTRGVLDVSVSLASEEAVVKHSGTPTSKLVEAVRTAGYDAVTYVVIFKIRSISPEELGGLTAKLEAYRGVVKVEADYASDTLRIEYNPLSTDPDELEGVLRSWGLSPVRTREQLSTPDVVAASKTLREYSLRLAVGAVFSSLTLFALYTNQPLLALVAATPVQFYSGSIFHLGALRALRNHVGNMDTLVSLASNISYFYSLYEAVFRGSAGFVDVAALLITFVLVGKTVEVYTKARTLSELASTLPQRAVVIRNGEQLTVDTRTIGVGDIVVLSAGDKAVVDGVVEDGHGEMDESVVTGESKPVLKRKGDPVYSGSTLISGNIKVYATRVGSKTYFEQVEEAVRRAQAAKLPIQRVVDRVSAVFTPLILVVSAATFLTWHLALHSSLNDSLAYSVAVLAAACPCALGLATPMAVSLGVKRASKMGIVVKRGEAYELAHKVSIVVFDKTGTLTEDKFEVESYTEHINGALELAASVEAKSQHPYARALLEAFGKRYEAEEFDSFVGEGVMGVVGGKTVLVGSKHFIESNATHDGALADDEASVYVAVDGKPAASVRFKQKVKPEATSVVNTLRKMGIRVVMVTGDSKLMAKAVADELGIDEFYAEFKPEEKAELVSKLRGNGVVMFVGDGVNDAPALTRADVGVAMGTEVAKAAADIVLTGGDLRGILQLIVQSRKVYSKIRQNLAWAFGYNSAILPVAAGLLTPFGLILQPQWAALAMSLSSVLVTIWSRV